VIEWGGGLAERLVGVDAGGGRTAPSLDVALAGLAAACSPYNQAKRTSFKLIDWLVLGAGLFCDDLDHASSL